MRKRRAHVSVLRSSAGASAFHAPLHAGCTLLLTLAGALAVAGRKAPVPGRNSDDAPVLTLPAVLGRDTGAMSPPRMVAMSYSVFEAIFRSECAGSCLDGLRPESTNLHRRRSLRRRRSQLKAMASRPGYVLVAAVLPHAVSAFVAVPLSAGRCFDAPSLRQAAGGRCLAMQAEAGHSPRRAALVGLGAMAALGLGAPIAPVVADSCTRKDCQVQISHVPAWRPRCCAAPSE
jgi:hypothetical protein